MDKDVYADLLLLQVAGTLYINKKLKPAIVSVIILGRY